MKSANIVILASSFNPSIATKDWLQANVIKERPSNFVNTPVFSAFETSSIGLIVDQSRFQLTARRPDDPVMDQCALVASKYVEMLPHTPYRALGFNYVFEIPGPPGSPEVEELRSRLVCGLGWLSERFAAFAVGTIVVGSQNGARVTLRLEPSLDESKPMTARANYHYGATTAGEIMDLSAKFRENSLEAAELVRAIVMGENVHADSVS